GMLWPWPPDVVEKHATGPSEAQQRGLFAPDLMAGFAGSEAVWLSTALSLQSCWLPILVRFIQLVKMIEKSGA
ncbi:MAG TPA: hypothetical protein VFP38_13795, partial [Bradyrhizobium sp.]|nr:hypothetical protein [Bradyrhizobium sp.]